MAVIRTAKRPSTKRRPDISKILSKYSLEKYKKEAAATRKC